MGPNTLTFTLEPGFDDALSAIVAAIDLPAGAAPIPEPSTCALVGIALIALARSLRRRV
jgi:hypothetical protein